MLQGFHGAATTAKLCSIAGDPGTSPLVKMDFLGIQTVVCMGFKASEIAASVLNLASPNSVQ